MVAAYHRRCEPRRVGRMRKTFRAFAVNYDCGFFQLLATSSIYVLGVV